MDNDVIMVWWNKIYISHPQDTTNELLYSYFSKFTEGVCVNKALYEYQYHICACTNFIMCAEAMKYSEFEGEREFSDTNFEIGKPCQRFD